MVLLMLKVLNLYAGIGGNRKLWDKVKVTAVEINPDIAAVYEDLYPGDKVIVGDAHQFLIDHLKEFDFIWSSPPCPTHSDIRRCSVQKGQVYAEYPDMKLYQEIILLSNFAPLDCQWVVENVKPYYPPLIEPFYVSRHCFWASFVIPDLPVSSKRKHQDIIGSDNVYGFDISKTNIKDKRRVLRNLVNPVLGKHVFDCAFKQRQVLLSELIKGGWRGRDLDG